MCRIGEIATGPGPTLNFKEPEIDCLAFQRLSRCQETEMHSPVSHGMVDKCKISINLRREERDFARLDWMRLDQT